MLKKYNDPAVQEIYKIALHVFSDDKDSTEDLVRRANIYAMQWPASLKCDEGDTEKSRKRLRRYLEDGIDCTRQRMPQENAFVLSKTQMPFP